MTGMGSVRRLTHVPRGAHRRHGPGLSQVPAVGHPRLPARQFRRSAGPRGPGRARAGALRAQNTRGSGRRGLVWLAYPTGGPEVDGSHRWPGRPGLVTRGTALRTRSGLIASAPLLLVRVPGHPVAAPDEAGRPRGGPGAAAGDSAGGLARSWDCSSSRCSASAAARTRSRKEAGRVGRATWAGGRGPSLIPRTRCGSPDDTAARFPGPPSPGRASADPIPLCPAPSPLPVFPSSSCPSLASLPAGPSSDAAGADGARAVGAGPSDPDRRRGSGIRFSFSIWPNPLGGACGAASLGYSGAHVKLLFNQNRPMSRRHYVMARGSLHRDAPRAETIDRTVTTERAFRLSAKAAPSGAALSTFSYAARPMRSADRMSCSGAVTPAGTQRRNTLR